MKTAAPAILCLALCACGARGGGAGTPDADIIRGPLSFDVVATIDKLDGALVDAHAKDEHHFTLTIDPAAGRAIGGGGGEARVVPLTSRDGRTFSIATSIGVGGSQLGCGTLFRMTYETMELTVTGTTFTGRATGFLFDTPYDTSAVRFEATLEGSPDTTPPSLILPPGGAVSDPLTAFRVWASEPLPASALARMVSGEGAVAGLVSEIIDGDVPLIASFAKPQLTLPPGQTFDALFSDDVTDLAGNVVPLGVAVPVTSVGAAPLVPADGFESATGDTLGGAALVRSGPGIPIAGAASAYVNEPEAPKPAGVTPSSKLVVRLAVPPGATTLAFSYRELVFVFGTIGNAHLGTVQIGSVGRAPGTLTPLPSPGDTLEKVAWETLPLWESPVGTMNVPLPEAVGPEVIVVISTTPSCGGMSPGLLVDDLRLE